LPTALPTENLACPVPSIPVVSPLGSGRVGIRWDPVAGADGYLFQLRIKGMDRWLVNFFSHNNRLSVGGPTHLEFEYRVKTVCSGGDSAYTDIFEFNTRNEGNLSSASARNKNDIDIADYLSAVSIAPNPVSNQFQLSYMPIGEDAKVSIHHINGQLIQEVNLVQDQFFHTIDASNWENGFYILSIKEKGQLIGSHKIAK